MSTGITRRAINAALLTFAGGVRAISAENLLPIRISGDQPLAWLPFFVATERKLWEANGLAPTNIPAATGLASIIALGAGAADVAPGSEMPAAIASLNRISVRIIGSFNKVENMELACRIAIRTPSDLAGKKIAVAQATPSHFYLSLLLKKYAVPATSVSIVRLGPAEMISALSGGSIDGFVWQEPFLSEAVKIDPSQIHRLAEAGLNDIYGVIMASDVAIQQRRSALVKTLRCIDAACSYIAIEPDEAARIGAKYAQMDPAIAKSAISRMKFSLELDASAIAAKMTKEANWALAEGVAKPGTPVPDFATLLDESLLKEARRPT